MATVSVVFFSSFFAGASFFPFAISRPSILSSLFGSEDSSAIAAPNEEAPATPNGPLKIKRLSRELQTSRWLHRGNLLNFSGPVEFFNGKSPASTPLSRIEAQRE